MQLEISLEYVDELRGLLGTQGHPATTEVDKSAVQKFARAIGETNPLYFDERYASNTCYGGIIAPPTFLAALVAAPLVELPDPPFTFQGVLHTDDVITYARPIRVGDVITTIPEFTDVFLKHGRRGAMLFKVFTTHYVDSHGKEIATLTTTEVAYR